MAFGKLRGWLEGAAAQVNPFDGGQTFSTVGKTPPTQLPGKWVGLQGGDQEYIPYFNQNQHGAPVQAPVPRQQQRQLNVSNAPMQPSLSVGTSNGMQPYGMGTEDDLTASSFAQPTSYNSGQATLNGQAFMGSMVPNVPHFYSMPTSSQPHEKNFMSTKYNWI